MGLFETKHSLFSADASKAYFEAASLCWAPVSLIILLVGVLGTGLHHHCDRFTYLYISIVLCLPGFLIPLLRPSNADKGRPYRERFWVKAAVWIAIFSFYGNYFWTHYFYQLLGARYLFDAHRFNDVPIVCFLCTYFYFTFYFALVNVVLRTVRRILPSNPLLSTITWWSIICALAYGTAVFEAVSIQHFPLYTYSDKKRFVSVGSIVYAIYFVIGFPMFFAIDEPEIELDKKTRQSQNPPKSTLYQVALNALAATAIVTLLLDFWRLYLGNIYALGRGKSSLVPFIYQNNANSNGFFSRMRDRVVDSAVLFSYNKRSLFGKWQHKVVKSFPSNFVQRLRNLWPGQHAPAAIVFVQNPQPIHAHNVEVRW